MDDDPQTLPEVEEDPEDVSTPGTNLGSRVSSYSLEEIFDIFEALAPWQGKLKGLHDLQFANVLLQGPPGSAPQVLSKILRIPYEQLPQLGSIDVVADLMDVADLQHLYELIEIGEALGLV